MGIKIFSKVIQEDSGFDAYNMESSVAEFLNEHKVGSKVTWLQSIGHRDGYIYLTAIIEFRDEPVSARSDYDFDIGTDAQ